MRIPDEKIDEVRSSADIVDVISAYVQLRKRGKNYLGRCPFHQEKTPSFNVSADKQMYYCFGCGAGGNVFTFLMQHDKLTFVEAVQMLAERAGIALPTDGPSSQSAADENEALYAVSRCAARYFYDTLMAGAEAGTGLAYFRSRGFSDETIKKFGLGYSLNAWDGLMRHAQREGFSLDVLVKAGLALQREEGTGAYDRFRGRAMFPIFSTTGKVIAFGARKLRDDDKMAKYVNSPETPIYHKGKTLYGLSFARDAIREKDNVILVEGYADLITVAQAGIGNIVASSGTALTEDQIKLIERYTRTITLVYDADSAGSKATLRGVDLVIEQGLDVRVAELPEGEDPDTFVRKEGGEAFQKLIDGAESFLDFKANYFRRLGMLANAEGKTRAIRSIVGTIARMNDELRRNVYIQSLAEKYGLSELVLQHEVEAIRIKSVQEQRHVPAGGAAQRAAQSQPAASQELPAGERDAIYVILHGGEEISRFVFSYVEPSMFLHPQARAAAETLLRLYQEHGAPEPSAVIDAMDDDGLKRFVSGILMQKYDIAKAWRSMGSAPEEPDIWRMAEGAVVALRVRALDHLLGEANRAFKDAEAKGEDLSGYRQHLFQLQQEKRDLLAHGLPQQDIE